MDLIELYLKHLDLADVLVSTVRQLRQAEAQISAPDAGYRVELNLVYLMPAP